MKTSLFIDIACPDHTNLTKAIIGNMQAQIRAIKRAPIGDQITLQDTLSILKGIARKLGVPVDKFASTDAEIYNKNESTAEKSTGPKAMIDNMPKELDSQEKKQNKEWLESL